ncbi:Carbonic anhydrase 2 [wastewater metagenome]|uniref:carbonic anhydrase n=2 Tax=unclassified sequences TaxID=12908 RepID=A0A5B8RJM1_9ZZZZ|nr:MULTISPECIES: carbonate dehydratase [Arhodomonas]MCS4503509.1 carbonate dehydratase [Arhodomonas aquaeolei]QEA07902.1 carbonic anhydrase 2 [uncultured organism]
MSDILDLLENNRRWSERLSSERPDFFSRLARQQNPDYLWIGCSDSRVPANDIVDLMPGELFVHRNVGNVVVHSDMNAMSVLQFAVEVLHVRHIIVTGHYGCGGVRVAMGHRQFGLIDNWLRHIRDVYHLHETELDAIEDEERRTDRLCELNVVEQVRNVCYTTIVQNAWARGQTLAVHGWVYGLVDGRVNDLSVSVRGPGEIDRIYRMDPIGD